MWVCSLGCICAGYSRNNRLAPKKIVSIKEVNLEEAQAMGAPTGQQLKDLFGENDSLFAISFEPVLPEDCPKDGRNNFDIKPVSFLDRWPSAARNRGSQQCSISGLLWFKNGFWKSVLTNNHCYVVDHFEPRALQNMELLETRSEKSKKLWETLKEQADSMEAKAVEEIDTKNLFRPDAERKVKDPKILEDTNPFVFGCCFCRFFKSFVELQLDSQAVAWRGAKPPGRKI